jgi:hypothetical protein
VAGQAGEGRRHRGAGRWAGRGSCHPPTQPASQPATQPATMSHLQRVRKKLKVYNDCVWASCGSWARQGGRRHLGGAQGWGAMPACTSCPPPPPPPKPRDGMGFNGRHGRHGGRDVGVPQCGGRPGRQAEGAGGTGERRWRGGVGVGVGCPCPCPCPCQCPWLRAPTYRPIEGPGWWCCVFAVVGAPQLRGVMEATGWVGLPWHATKC